MARDYLSIPASSTDSERVFSFAKIIGTDRRARLSGENFEALQLLRSAFATGMITMEELSKERAGFAFANDWKEK